MQLALFLLCSLAASLAGAQSLSIAGLQAAGEQVAASTSAQVSLPPQPPRLPSVPLPLPFSPQEGTLNLESPAPSPAPVPAPYWTDVAGDENALKIFSQGSRNIRQLQTTGLAGWVDGTNPCQGWTGITCNAAGRVITLELPNWGIETRLPPELAWLSELQRMNLTGNNLVGGLPSNFGSASVFPNLTILDLSNNPNLSGALPPNWGTQGAFARLEKLSLGLTGISGQLPLAWGGDLSLPNLTSLDLQSNLLAGELPAGWGTVGAFAKLQSLKLTNNSLSGSLPAQWGSSSSGIVFPALKSLDMANNSLEGYLPSDWGSGFQNLSSLDLHANKLTGVLPSQWADGTGRWPNLTTLDLHDNKLVGPIPAAWADFADTSNFSLVLLPGNFFCGVIPLALVGGVQAANGSALGLDSLGSCLLPSAPVPAPAPAPPMAAAVEPSTQPAPAPAPAPAPVNSYASPPQMRNDLPAPAPESAPQAALSSSSPLPVPAPMPLPSPLPVPAPTPSLASVPAPVPISTLMPAPMPISAITPAPMPIPALLPAPIPISAPVPAPLPSPQQLSVLEQPVPAPAPAPMAPAPIPFLAGFLGPMPVPAPAPAFPPLESEPSARMPAPNPALQSPVDVAGPAEVVGAPAPVSLPAPAPAAVQLPVVAGPPFALTPSQAPLPSDQVAQVLARYNLTGPNLANNASVRAMVLSALTNTLSTPAISSLELQSFASSVAPATGRRLSASSDSAQAIFLINTTSDTAPGLLDLLNNASTSSTFSHQLAVEGLPSVEPELQEARITDPLVSSPQSPAAAPPLPLVPFAVPQAKSLSSGAIGGIVVGAVAAAILVAALSMCYLCRKRRSSADVEKGDKVECESPQKQSAWSFWKKPEIQKAPQDDEAIDNLDKHAARAARKHRKPQDSPTKPMEAAVKLQDLDPAVFDSKNFQTTHSSFCENDYFEEEERQNVTTIEELKGAPPTVPASTGLSQKHRLDSAQSMKYVASKVSTQQSGAALPGDETPPSDHPASEAHHSDHTAMNSEIVADHGSSTPSVGTLTASTSGSSEGRRRNMAAASASARQVPVAANRTDEKRELLRDQPVSSQPSGSGTSQAPSSGRSRSAVLLRALERELRTSQQAPPSSYSRRYTAAEGSLRQPKADPSTTEIEEAPLLRKAESSGRRRPAAEAIRRNLEALEALEKKHSGGKASTDTAKLRAEVEQILGQGGYLKRAAEEKAPPPSYHRRLAEEVNHSRVASGGSRHTSGGPLSGRQNSIGPQSRTSAGVESTHRTASGQGDQRKQGTGRDRGSKVLSGPPMSRLNSAEPVPRGELRRQVSGSGEVRLGERRASNRNASNERLPRLNSGAGTSDNRSQERLLRRQQSGQREALLRDLERQLGLEPAVQTGKERPDSSRKEGRDSRPDQRREIAQRARKLLEDLGGREPGEDLSTQLERLNSRRLKQVDDGIQELRRPARKM